ncbi:MAG: hypothetical protein V1903_14515 [Bacteroidota bacterium]
MRPFIKDKRQKTKDKRQKTKDKRRVDCMIARLHDCKTPPLAGIKHQATVEAPAQALPVKTVFQLGYHK